jgi:hypothetical protein
LNRTEDLNCSNFELLNRGCRQSTAGTLNLLNGSIFFVDRDLGCQSFML